MENTPKIYSGITFKVLCTYNINSEQIKFIDNNIEFIATRISIELNKETTNIYKNNINGNFKILMRNRLNSLIENYNRNKSNPFYLWLDEDIMISESELSDKNLDLGLGEDHFNSLLNIAFNIHNEFLVQGKYVAPDSYYQVFSICIFFRNAPISIIEI